MRHRRASVFALSAVVLPLMVATPTPAQGMMGGGMMGGGMMGDGMRGAPVAPGPATGSDPRWDQLSAYVQRNGLACLACHTYSGRGSGPAFAEISRRFAREPGARAQLARAIGNGVSGQWPGYPAMPGGLATPSQARELAGLILALSAS